LGNKEYCERGGKARKAHGKRYRQTNSVKWLNYSDPLSTIQERGYRRLSHERHKTREAKTYMTPKPVVLAMALFNSCWLMVALVGCSGPQVQQTESNSTGYPAVRPSAIEEKHLEPMLVMVSQLQIATLESLDAAKMVGTPDQELVEARQHVVSAEQLLQQGKASYTAKQYQDAWEQLRAADIAFRRAEEAAVRAGLGQLERELLTDYGRLLTAGHQSRRYAMGTVRVSQENVNLRDGAGTHFQVIGKVQFGDTLTLLAEAGQWYRVRTNAGGIGWVSKGLVTHPPQPEIK
jgi:hypothetical protein